MKVLSAFVKQVGLVLIGALVLGGYPLYAYAEAEMIVAVAVGCGICTLNVVAGCLSIVMAFDKPHTAFMKILFGGMAVRMILIGLTVFLLIKFTIIHILGLILSLFVFYTTYQVLEIRYLLGQFSAAAVPKEEVSQDG